MVDLITSIPGDVAACILTSWLPFVLLPRMDSAYSNRTQREKYLSLLREPKFVISNCSQVALLQGANNFVSKKCLAWITLRGVKFSQILLLGQICSDRDQPLQPLGGHVKSLHFEHFLMPSVDSHTLTTAAQSCPNLEVFAARKSRLDTTLLTVFSTCTSLTTIRLVNCCPVTGFRAKNLANLKLPHLHTISVASGQQRTSFVAALVLMAVNLKHLHCADMFDFLKQRNPTALGAERTDMLRIAQHCPNLHTLAMNVRLFDESILIAMLTQCTKIVSLDLDVCTQLTKRSVQHLATTLTALQTLRLNGNSIHAQELEALQHTAKTLTSLDVRNCTYYARSGLEKALQTCSLLTTLTLQLTYVDYAFMGLDVEWPLMCNIHTLTITNYAENHGDQCSAVFPNIAQFCQNLEQLHLDFTIVDLSQLTVVVEQCGMLCLLALKLCDFSNPDVVRQWVTVRPGLKVCDIRDVPAANVFEL